MNQGLVRQDRQDFLPRTVAILAFVEPVWIVTTPRPMEILESQVHVSPSWTPSELHMERQFRSPSRR